MHGYYMGFSGSPRFGGFGCLNYVGSPVGFWLMAAMMVLVALAVVLILVALLKRHKHGLLESEALAIIKRRYANGEITSEEFQRMKKELR